jgi:hypothetical protein
MNQRRGISFLNVLTAMFFFLAFVAIVAVAVIFLVPDLVATRCCSTHGHAQALQYARAHVDAIVGAHFPNQDTHSYTHPHADQYSN